MTNSPVRNLSSPEKRNTGSWSQGLEMQTIKEEENDNL